MNSPVHPCHRGKSHKQPGWTTRPAWDSIEFSWLSYSDETHINDRGHILEKCLLPIHPGPTPTSHRFVNKRVFAFFPIAATKLRSLPPVQAKDLGQNVLKTAHPISLAMPPGLVTRTNSRTFHDPPTIQRFATELQHAQDGRNLSERRVPPIQTQPPALCATETEGATCILTPAQSVLSYETSPPTERLGLYDLPACSGATWFPGWKQAVEFCRRNPATRAPQDT